MHAIYTTKSKATKRRARSGGWVIDHIDGWYWTDDEETAQVLVSGMFQIGYSSAARVLRSPVFKASTPPVVNSDAVKKVLRGEW